MAQTMRIIGSPHRNAWSIHVSSIKDVSAKLVINHLSKKLRTVERRVRLLEHRHKRERKLFLKIRNARKKDLLSEIAEEDKRSNDAYLALFLIIALLTLSTATTIIYFNAEHTNKHVAYEFASYAMPAMAALIAGLTALIKRAEIIWFWTSTIFVLAGVILFVITEGFTAQLLWNLIIVYGMTAAFYVVPYNYFKAKRLKKKVSRIQLLASLLSSVILISSLAALMFFPDAKSPPELFTKTINGIIKNNEEESSLLKCNVISKDIENKTTKLLCTSK